MMTISVTLTAYNMGSETTEADFDAWTSWVVNHIDEALGFAVAEVGQHPYAGGPARDTVAGATEEQAAAIRGWLSHEGWDAFCADASAWPQQQ